MRPFIVTSELPKVCGEFNPQAASRQAKKHLQNSKELVLITGKNAQKVVRRSKMHLQKDIAATVQYSRILAQDPTQEKHFRGTMWHTDTAWSHTVPIAPLRFITGTSVLPTQWITGTIDATEAHAAYFSRLDPRWRKEFLKDPLLPFRIFSILNYEDSDVLDHCVQQAVQTGTAEIVQFAPGELVHVSGFAVHAAMNHEQAAAAAVTEPRLTIESYFM